MNEELKALRLTLQTVPGTTGLSAGVKVIDGKVCIVFRRTVDWLKLDKGHAYALADMIRAKADELP